MFSTRPFFKKTIATLSLVLSLSVPILVQAQPAGCVGRPGDSIRSPLSIVACRAGILDPEDANEVKLAETIGLIIGIVLSFMGILFAGLTIYGGFLWMTARGNEQQVTTSQTLIRNSVIGIVVIFSAFAVSRFVIDALTQVTV